MTQQEHDAPENGVETVETESGTSRRSFLRAAGATAAGVLAGSLVSNEVNAAPAPAAAAGGFKMAGAIPTPKADTKTLTGGKFPKGTVMAPGKVLGANDRVIVAFVGVGGMGGAHVGNYIRTAAARNIQIGGICDVYKTSRERNANAVKEKNVQSASFVMDKDYRKLLENKDIDAITIATPEHWHCQVGVQAMQAGKHVYIQKPMARYLDEAFQVYDTAKSTGKVVQVGSQGCSNMVYHAAGKAAREGKLGRLVLGQGSYTRNNPKGEWNYTIPADLTAENIDWEAWLGSAPMRPFATTGPAGDGEQPMRDDAAARKSRYRKYWDYSAGIMGDLMPHKLHPFLIASGNPEYPTRVSAIGTRLEKDRDVDDTITVTAQFPSGWTMLFVGSTVNEQGLQDMFRGEKATMYFGNGVEIKPERPFAEEIEASRLDIQGPTYESHELHEENWLAAIRANNPMMANCNYELATKVQTIISLAEMSSRWNKTMIYDEKTRKYTAG